MKKQAVLILGLFVATNIISSAANTFKVPDNLDKRPWYLSENTLSLKLVKNFTLKATARKLIIERSGKKWLQYSPNSAKQSIAYVHASHSRPVVIILLAVTKKLNKVKSEQRSQEIGIMAWEYASGIRIIDLEHKRLLNPNAEIKFWTQSPWSPDGRYAAFTHGTGPIHIIDADRMTEHYRPAVIVSPEHNCGLNLTFDGWLSNTKFDYSGSACVQHYSFNYDIATGKSIKLSGPSGGSEHDYNREPAADKKLTLYWFALPILLLIGVLAILSYFSRRPGNVGLYDNKLKHCRSKKNCVCSEFVLTEGGDKKSAINPIAMDKLDDQVWEKIKQIILASGGKIMKDNDKYIWATFRTRIFRFTDDLEIRLDEHNHLLHIRSASRVGKSDFGTNRRRLVNLKKALQAISDTSK